MPKPNGQEPEEQDDKTTESSETETEPTEDEQFESAFDAGADESAADLDADDSMTAPKSDEEEDDGEETPVEDADKSEADKDADGASEAPEKGEKKEPESESPDTASEPSALDAAKARATALKEAPASDEAEDKAEAEKVSLSEAEKRFQEEKSALETQLAEKDAELVKARAAQKPVKSMRDIINDSITDDASKGKLLKFLDEYPENTQMMDILSGIMQQPAPAAAPASTAGMTEEQLTEHAEMRAQLDVANYWDQVQNGLVDAKGNVTEGHVDARAIGLSAEFQTFVKDMGFADLANSANAADGIAVLNAYKEVQAAKVKTTEDAKNAKELDAEDKVHSETLRTTKSKPGKKGDRETDNDLDAGFAEGLDDEAQERQSIRSMK